tara:strand:- start:164 stop:730 length:567 start_codon:yes stop_codon:yes gene_type:complete
MKSSKYKPPKNPVKDRAMQLCAEVEKRRAEISMRWGETRFNCLLDNDLKNRLIVMRNKFESVKAGVNYLATIEMSEGMLRGYDQCEDNAKQRGHQELNGDIWSYHYKRTDTRFLLVKDDHFYKKAVAMAKNESPPPVVMSLVELLRLIPVDNWVFINNIKAKFPGSEVIEPTTDKDIESQGPISSFTA